MHIYIKHPTSSSSGGAHGVRRAYGYTYCMHVNMCLLYVDSCTNITWAKLGTGAPRPQLRCQNVKYRRKNIFPKHRRCNRTPTTRTR